MNENAMSLTAPLGRGWNRMVEMLFKPFNLGKWLVVAFAAWMSGLASGGGSNAGGSIDTDDGIEIGGPVRGAWEWVQGHELMLGVIAGAVLLLLALIVVVIWVSSRGKFVFLDNVVRDKAEILKPWREYARLGNSLFWFRIVVALIAIPVAVGAVCLVAWLAVGPDGWAHHDGPAIAAGVVATVVLGATVALVLAYLVFFLDAFVVPLMHRHDITTMEAWRRFFALFRQRPGWFLLSGLFVFMLAIVVFSAIMVTGFMTCCLGFVLLALPFVSTVVLLPVLVTYRAFTVEFLGQIDPEVGLVAREA